MGKFKTFVFLTVVAAFIAGNAHAYCTAILCYSKVDRLIAFGDNAVHVMMDVPDAELNKLDCQPGTSKEIVIPTSYDEWVRDRMYSALLSARMSDNPITVRMVNGAGACEVWYVNAE